MRKHDPTMTNSTVYFDEYSHAVEKHNFASAGAGADRGLSVQLD